METAMTVEEVAKVLRVHPNAVYRLIASGDLKTFRLGKGRGAMYKILPADLKAFIESKKEPAA